MAYLLDSNVFIEAKNNYYGFDFVPAFWEWIDREHANGTVYSIEKVRDELIGGDDQLATWAEERGDDFFLQADSSVLSSLATVAAWAQSGDYEPGAANQFLQAADFYLVAHAHAKGFDVVTHEIVSTSTKKIKIPNACIGNNVKTLNIFQLLRKQKARFVLAHAG
jgi:predicted nucleic acid-binding protein